MARRDTAARTHDVAARAPVGQDGEPITAYGGHPPFSGPAVQAAGAFDEQASHRARNGQQRPGGLIRHHGADPFPAAGQAHPAAGGEFVVEPAAGELGVQQRRGKGCRQPDPIVGQWLFACPPQALQVDQLGVVWLFQSSRRFRVAFSAQCQHVAALLQASCLDLLE